MQSPITLHWFRRDLRLHDNTALIEALKHNERVQPIFIFDKNILDELHDKNDKRVVFIHNHLERLHKQFQQWGSSLWVFYGTPVMVFHKLISEHTINAVYANHDYEPYAQQRDSEIKALCQSHNIAFKTFKDQVIFEKSEVLKPDGKPYTVYTPYSRAWKKRFAEEHIQVQSIDSLKHKLHQTHIQHFLSLREIGFNEIPIQVPPARIDDAIILNYHKTRDIPGISGTSRLSVHLRFGTVSIRELVLHAQRLNEKYLNELIWREFYMMILWHFPHVVTRAFKPEYDHIKWRNHEDEFKRWCNGTTGFPIVDAGMRELNETGFMHNRVRMITASFLIKDLLIDWRWGEAYFARKLLDFELSSNNGGWQWAASSGCDAAPYFRIFNPQLQTEKFDPQLLYIKKWIPELGTSAYPSPIVHHATAKERTLQAYKAALQQKIPSSSAHYSDRQR